MGDFSHLNKEGKAEMVDISAKIETKRQARVVGEVLISQDCCDQLTNEAVAEITTTARISGINAAKQTSSLIPLCHQVPLSKVGIEINFKRSENIFEVEAKTSTTSATGVEMEAFIGANLAAITIYDMIKAVNPEAVLGGFKLLEKSGGKAGAWTRK